jgi:hypothetical protein
VNSIGSGYGLVADCSEYDEKPSGATKLVDDDHVDGVMLRLRTATTNGPIVHPPGDRTM